ncbi:DNA-binding transcriptional regulator, AcrR family [Sinosporangium album]|uniref:DNA-binding transcriptional regulator, AcrR family n=1 Tax=Sinosporangium album TaxID=504805 RepID=A0A1G7S7R0_9ACTN|nr:TetR/AcrR family transcriptional regulator [Sinosporangium album]SDG18982.1 DNA-binding transcriptional regulator, AcrR family [Sinosporangium album]
MDQEAPLRERKRRRAQEAIIDAAFTLFTERGFADVTVAEIADRAEVGRTTFFRYFRDKQEVVFAREQHLIEQLRALGAERSERPQKAPTFREALDHTRRAVETIIAAVTADLDRYRLHERLIADNAELYDRKERKLTRLTEVVSDALQAQGTPPLEAALAAHMGLACYRAARAAAGPDPDKLKPAIDAAFDLLLHKT